MSLEWRLEGFKEFEAAVRRNPQYVIQRGNQFITRALAEYRRVIWRNPWRVGMSGGGAPVLTGHLRDTHNQHVAMLMGRIYPTASYAGYVHHKRPWLAYAFENADGAVRQHEQDLAGDILAELAR
jgi:hypothetical protein